jgi:hypothetical protein
MPRLGTGFALGSNHVLAVRTGDQPHEALSTLEGGIADRPARAVEKEEGVIGARVISAHWSAFPCPRNHDYKSISVDSTFSMVKYDSRDHVRSKTDEARQTRVVEKDDVTTFIG